MKGNYSEPVDNIGDIMTVEDFKECVKDGGFIDYDGYGYPVKDNMVDESRALRPSKVKSGRHIPIDATHVIWYNK